eukprot:g26377.t1
MTQPNPYPSVLGPRLSQYFLMASKYIRSSQMYSSTICQTNSPIRNKSLLSFECAVDVALKLSTKLGSVLELMSMLPLKQLYKDLAKLSSCSAILTLSSSVSCPNDELDELKDALMRKDSQKNSSVRSPGLQEVAGTAE